MTGWVDRARGVDVRVRDALLSAALVAFLAAELALSDSLQGPAWVNWGFGMVFPIALFWRRPYPLLVFVAMATAGGTSNLLDGDLIENPFTPFFCVFITSYALGTRTPSRGLAQAVVVALAGLTYVNATADPFVVEDLVFSSIIVFAMPFLAGRAVRGQRERAAALREANLALERDTQQASALAVANERARIARELHDVVAHSMSVMVIQAEGARRLVAKDPERAGQALDQIVDTGRSGLQEMRKLLGVLRGEDEQARTAPQPGLGNIDLLVQRARDAGLVVDVRVVGAPLPLPPGVDVSAYRIVQEALTNTLQHGGKGVRAIVTITYSPSSLDLVVVDNGPGPGYDLGARGSSVGHGIVGMRERVALYGGDLLVGPGPDGGFEVRARIPIGG